jgi:hypothetical protein
MAGYICVSNVNGFGLSSSSFREIVERTRVNIIDDRELMNKIYEPLDEGYLDIISVEEQDEKGFNDFYVASSNALGEYKKEKSGSNHYLLTIKSWDELLDMLRQDSRFYNS